MKQIFLGLALSVSFLVSPEIQVILANSVGMLGVYFYPMLLLVAGLALLVLRSYSFSSESEFTVLFRHYGRWLPLSSLFASRTLFFITASTIVLATSGFVFNEVFLSSFPNFGFAFLVLGLVIGVNLLGSTVSCRVQFFAVALWLVAMLYLAVHGLIADVHLKAGGEFEFSYQGLFLPFLLLIGVDLALATKTKSDPPIPLRSLWFGLLLVLLLLGLWGFSMGKMLNSDVLLNSFIPHTKTARRLLGDHGRIVLGVAMISGTFALVNGFMHVLVVQIREICTNTSLPTSWIHSNYFKKTVVVLMGCLPGLMMAKGMAGHDSTEVFIRASLIFWLCHYGLMNGIVIRHERGLWQLLHVGALLLLITVAGGLLYFDPGRVELASALGYVLLGAGGLAGVLSFWVQKDKVVEFYGEQ